MFSYLRGLYKSTLQALGFTTRQATVAILGLDNSGKSTLQTKLLTGKFRNCPPTHRPSCETMQIGGLTLTTWDLGGHIAARQAQWHKYCGTAQGILFVVDAAEEKRIPEAAKELHELCSSIDLTMCPIAVFANKSEVEDAMGPDALEKALGLEALRKHHKVHLFPGSVSEGTGYIEAFQWLENAMDSLDAQASGAASG